MELYHRLELFFPVRAHADVSSPTAARECRASMCKALFETSGSDGASAGQSAGGANTSPGGDISASPAPGVPDGSQRLNEHGSLEQQSHCLACNVRCGTTVDRLSSLRSREPRISKVTSPDTHQRAPSHSVTLEGVKDEIRCEACVAGRASKVLPQPSWKVNPFAGGGVRMRASERTHDPKEARNLTASDGWDMGKSLGAKQGDQGNDGGAGMVDKGRLGLARKRSKPGSFSG